MSGFHLDPGALRAVTGGLLGAARTFDEAGRGVPRAADAGLAAGLVADILRSVGEAGERLTTDAATLAGVADRCNVDVATTDSQVAGELLTGAP